MSIRGVICVSDQRFRRGRSLIAPFLVIALLGLALLAGSGASSAQTFSASSGQTSTDLNVGQGRLLRFNEPVESVLIADTTVADLQIVSSDMVYVFGLKPGVTNLIAITADQRIEASMQFRVSVDNSPARDANRKLQPESAVDLSIFGNRIVATGHVRSVEEAVDVDNVARTYSPPEHAPLNNTAIAGSQQVNIRVRFAEVSRSELLSYGLDWSASVTQGDFSFGMFKRGGTGEPNLGFGIKSNNVDIEVFLEALQRNGIVKILAEPNLTAVTGSTASFLAGGEIPIPIPQGNQTVTVEYKPFGVSLGFTPTLISDDRIALNVQPEVSSLSDGGSVNVSGFSLPSFVVRRADTTVEVASGQTFAIAGLFQQRFARNLEKFPILGDVPILGALFQSQRFQKEETELVILITPYLVRPVSSRSMATPMDRPAAQPRPKKTSGMGMIVK
ncbi:type II and III secretion system protein family protein [Aquamicrobium sp. LC103]|uniref:type II and III secretion system protein family protein n=1 Tax=Aquamicrobium sp. LC103 TaxID=1120658 RepID=UPI0006996B66|nr:type II and III secretion system protein family protein [Aquamicrobium sp. LC103]TKT74526.1 type II and III secretion system protein family protein [Aquamicrobium sp. LC103]